MSKFLNDICRTVGCDANRICERCGNPTKTFFKKMLENVFCQPIPMDETFDDLDQVELLMACEEEYDIEINDHEADKLKTPDMFYNYLFRVLGKANVQSM